MGQRHSAPGTGPARDYDNVMNGSKSERLRTLSSTTASTTSFDSAPPPQLTTQTGDRCHDGDRPRAVNTPAAAPLSPARRRASAARLRSQVRKATAIMRRCAHTTPGVRGLGDPVPGSAHGGTLCMVRAKNPHGNPVLAVVSCDGVDVASFTPLDGVWLIGKQGYQTAERASIEVLGTRGYAARISRVRLTGVRLAYLQLRLQAELEAWYTSGDLAPFTGYCDVRPPGSGGSAIRAACSVHELHGHCGVFVIALSHTRRDLFSLGVFKRSGRAQVHPAMREPAPDDPVEIFGHQTPAPGAQTFHVLVRTDNACATQHTLAQRAVDGVSGVCAHLRSHASHLAYSASEEEGKQG